MYICKEGRMAFADCKESKTNYSHKDISIASVLNKCNFKV